jgi:integrase
MLDLPENLDDDQLEILRQYLQQQERSRSEKTYGKQNYYQDKKEIIGKKLIIFKHKQKKKDVYYMRLYVGNKKYKTLSLNTSEESKAVELALEKWRKLQNHIDVGGKVFELTTEEYLKEYDDHLKSLYETNQIKLQTIRTKRTSLKKLRIYLSEYEKPSSIPPLVLNDYVKWRRTKNWDKSKHKRNPDPPTDLTINAELSDFKGFFDWCSEKKIYNQEIKYPFLKYDWKKSKEKNPSFEIDDWMEIVYYLRTWTTDKEKLAKRKKFGIFYRKVFSEFLKVLGNSGLRPSEAILLKWEDVEIASKIEDSPSGSKERFIARIQVSPDTKTGSRLVICGAGIYFKRIRDLYLKEEGRSPKKNEYIFRNIGTTHSREDQFVGNHLTSDHMRKLWYEMMDDLRNDKGIEFKHSYTMYSCRSFFINQRLEMGISPVVVADLVGHSIKTMERHYKNIKLKMMEPELVQIRKRKLEESDFQTFDLDLS